MTITVPPDCNPKKDKDFMNPVMLEYFRRKLLTWRAELLEESNLNVDESAPMKHWSSGQRQRLHLALAMGSACPAVLLDEPTANLDPGATALVEEVISGYREEQKVPVVWVGHDGEQLRRVANTALRMHGKKLERSW